MTVLEEFSILPFVRSLRSHGISVLLGVLLTTAVAAAAGDNTAIVRDLASRVGPVIGSALACPDIARPRVQAITDKFQAVIREVASSAAGQNDLTQLFKRYVADGRNAVTTGKIDCKSADHQLADLEKTVSGPAPASSRSSLSGVLAPPPAAAATAPTATLPPPSTNPVHGVTDNEIRFGIVAPFSGASKALGNQMKLGIDTAFDRVNDAGGVNGRKLKLIPADDGYEPSRTIGAMTQLYEKDQVFGFIGNVGTPTAVVAVPYALKHHILFFGAFTGAGLLRNDPPDRYVFNYRPSYMEETAAVVHYLVKVRRIPPRRIAVFAQQDAYGDAGFEGVAKAFRELGLNDAEIPRLNYKRNTIDVDDAVSQLKRQRPPIKAVVMVATYRAAAEFIEKTRGLYPDMIYTNVSFVGSTELAAELMLHGPRFANGVIVTQVVPAVSGYSSAVLEYKSALAKYFPGEEPDYVSLEGYIASKILIQALKKAGRQLDTEKLVDTLENMRNFDLGLGTSLGFGRSEHQASHKIWGTALNASGKYQPIDLE